MGKAEMSTCACMKQVSANRATEVVRRNTRRRTHEPPSAIALSTSNWCRTDRTTNPAIGLLEVEEATYGIYMRDYTTYASVRF